MLQSMTGYGRSQLSDERHLVVCEIRGVNHKFSHFHLHLEKRFSFLDIEIRKILKEKISRGRVDLYLEVNEIQASSDKIKFNSEIFHKYIEIFRQAKKEYNLSGDLKWQDFATLPEVITLQEENEEEELEEIILKAVNMALESFIKMRKEEGKRLQLDIENQLLMLKNNLKIIEERVPEILEEYKIQLQKRIEELMGKSLVNEERLLEELAYFVEKTSINEEIVRLKSHFKQFENTLHSGKPVGRKLDFIAQELYRETNTIGSKTPDARTGNLVVEMKTVIDKIREQIQNIE